MPTQPQDHKSATDAGHKFTVAGKHYTLPPLKEDTASAIPGGVTYDVVMNPDDTMAQMRLAFMTLEAVKPSEAAMTALKSLPTDEMLEIVGEWMGGLSGSSA